MVTFGEPPRIDSAGIALTRGFGQLSIGDGALDGPRFAADREVLGACGGAALYRRSLFDAVGLFDESLVMYWEDYDIALRAQAAGLRSLYVGSARVRHRGSATIGRQSAEGVYYYLHNREIVVRRCVPLGLRLRPLPMTIWTNIKLLALFAGRGKACAAVRGGLAGRWLPPRPRAESVRVQSGVDVSARLATLLAEGSRLRLEVKRLRRSEP
jgi:GT2 family glycosyltransferase